MDTKSIVLEETTIEEFWELEDQWGRDRPIFRHELYGRIHNPILQDSLDYGKLIFRLTQIPNFSKVRVRNGRGWRDLTPESASKPEHLMQLVAQLATLAENEPLKRHYMDLTLRTRTSSAVMEFREDSNTIAGYAIRADQHATDFFTVKPKRSEHFTYANGIWVPRAA